jgi:predicted nucleotidyltransferase
MTTVNHIAGLSQLEMDSLNTIFSSAPSVSDVILYGSRAKGDHRAGSDIDLTIKGTGLTTRWLMNIEAKVDDLLLPYEVDLSIWDHISNGELREHIQRLGKVVFHHEQ